MENPFEHFQIVLERAPEGYATVKGIYIEGVQKLLNSLGYPLDVINGVFDEDTENAIRKFQTAHGIEAIGKLDGDTFRALGLGPGPSIVDRCIQVTMALEGHSFNIAAGNRDKQGMTWGAIGFCLGQRSLQPLLKEIMVRCPALVREVFGGLLVELRNMLEMPNKDLQVQWASQRTADDGKVLIEPWQSAFARLGNDPMVRAIQLRFVLNNYYSTAFGQFLMYHHARAGLSWALIFDVAVGPSWKPHVRKAVQAKLEAMANDVHPPALLIDPIHARNWREFAIKKVVESVPKANREKLEIRKNLFLDGIGFCNGQNWNLESWGLTKYLVSPLDGTSFIERI